MTGTPLANEPLARSTRPRTMPPSASRDCKGTGAGTSALPRTSQTPGAMVMERTTKAPTGRARLTMAMRPPG